MLCFCEWYSTVLMVQIHRLFEPVLQSTMSRVPADTEFGLGRYKQGLARFLGQLGVLLQRAQHVWVGVLPVQAAVAASSQHALHCRVFLLAKLAFFQRHAVVQLRTHRPTFVGWGL